MNMYLELIVSLIILIALVILGRKLTNTKYEKPLNVILFICYFVTLIYITFIRGGRSGISGVSIRFPLPFLQAIISLHYGMIANRSVLNVLLFVPFGFLFPRIIENFSKTIGKSKPVKWQLVVICGFTVSLLIEISQLVFKFGIFELDDLIKNTMGSFIGYYLYKRFIINNKFSKKAESKSMNEIDKGFILNLIRKSLSVADEVQLNFNSVENVTKVILNSGIILTVYPTVKSLAEDVNPSEKIKQLEEMLRKHYLLTLKQNILQGFEGEQVLKKLSENRLNCIALKGWELRKMYPEPTMRQMADLDILVKPYDYSAIKQVAEDCGFKTESDESSWKHDSFFKNGIQIEMHKRLTDDSDLIKSWENEMWNRAVKADDGSLYRMSDEDYYIFHFIHLHKDFMNGSLGLRRLIDTWLLSKREVDNSFVEEKLNEFGIYTFSQRIINLCKALMGKIDFDENSRILLNHALNVGIYGTTESYKAGRIASMSDGNLKSGKLRSLFSAVFLPISRMKAQFPVLEKWPVLLPFCWLKRIFRFLKGDLKKSRQLLDYSKINEEDYLEMKRFFEAGGVTDNNN